GYVAELRTIAQLGDITKLGDVVKLGDVAELGNVAQLGDVTQLGNVAELGQLDQPAQIPQLSIFLVNCRGKEQQVVVAVAAQGGADDAARRLDLQPVPVDIVGGLRRLTDRDARFQGDAGATRVVPDLHGAYIADCAPVQVAVLWARDAALVHGRAGLGQGAVNSRAAHCGWRRLDRSAVFAERPQERVARGHRGRATCVGGPEQVPPAVGQRSGTV